MRLESHRSSVRVSALQCLERYGGFHWCNNFISMFLTFKFYHNCLGMSSKDVIEFNLCRCDWTAECRLHLMQGPYHSLTCCLCRIVGVEVREREVVCYCSLQDRLEPGLAGPESQCETPCHPASSLTCGGPGALSLYQMSSGIKQPQALVDSEERNTEIVMVDHLRVGLDVMVMFVCLILILIIGIFILNKQHQYQQSYTELQ